MTGPRFFAGFLAVSVAIVGYGLIAAGGADMDTRFVDAKQECAEHDEYVTVLDGGAGMSIQGWGDESDGTDLATVACVLSELGVPESVVVRIDQTRALDGTQTAEWDGIAASWTYHPDVGLSLVMEVEQ